MAIIGPKNRFLVYDGSVINAIFVTVSAKRGRIT